MPTTLRNTDILFNDTTTLSTGGGAGSNTTNGYRVLPGGIILQWGSNTGSKDVWTTVNFSVSFPNACFGVQCTVNNGQRNSAGDKQDATYTQSTTTSSFQLMCNYETTGSANVAWLAVGY